MTNTDAVTTRTLHQNLGRGIFTIVYALAPIEPQPDAALGKQIDALIGTAVKAVIIGRQTNKQVREAQQKARQAFARALARKVARLG